MPAGTRRSRASRDKAAPELPQTKQPVVKLDSSEAQVWEHRLGPSTAVHVSSAEARTLGFESYLTFEIVVSADGRVESATPVGDEKRHLDEGRAIEMARRFKPWTRDGKSIRVRVTDDVMLLPPELMGACSAQFSRAVGSEERENRAFTQCVLRQVSGLFGDDSGRWKRSLRRAEVCSDSRET